MKNRVLSPVEASDLVYRAIKKSSWLNNYAVLGAAFMLRENEDYLSVDRQGDRTQNAILEKYRTQFNKVLGAAVVEVLDCIEVGAEVYRMRKKGDKYYSGIFYPNEPDLRLSIADDLAELAKFVGIKVIINVNQVE